MGEGGQGENSSVGSPACLEPVQEGLEVGREGERTVGGPGGPGRLLVPREVPTVTEEGASSVVARVPQFLPCCRPGVRATHGAGAPAGRRGGLALGSASGTSSDTGAT